MNPLSPRHSVPPKPDHPGNEQREFYAALTLLACLLSLGLIYWSGQALVSWELHMADYVPKMEEIYAAY
jgi:hypothetical protein